MASTPDTQHPSAQHPTLPVDPTDPQAWLRYAAAWVELTPHLTRRHPRRGGRKGGVRHRSCSALDPVSGAQQTQRTQPAHQERQAQQARQTQHAQRSRQASAGGRLLTMHAYREPTPGARWQQLFRATWPAYRSWYVAGDATERPTIHEARAALARHLPELVPTWERLVELTGEDLMAARLLTMWRMPAYAAGCTQAIVPGEAPALVRNYDYDPDLFERVIASTNYSGTRKVIGTSDLLWGLLDGMNEDGLAISLTWGGRPDAGDGFGIPIVIRYVLETCSNVPSAIAALRRIPVAQAYNLSLVDTHGAAATVFVAPGEEPVVSDLPAVANHRLGEVEHEAAARHTRSAQRQCAATELVTGNRVLGEVVDGFLRDPLRNPDLGSGFGTLYTAAYEPARGVVTYHWPGVSWERGFDDDDADVLAPIGDA